MLKIKELSIILLILYIRGCKDASDSENFAFKYSKESINNYKVEFQLNPDSTYKIGLYNYFFDNYERAKRPQYKEGKLSKKEYEIFNELIDKSDIKRMKDSYGFDNTTDNSIIYMFELTRGGKTKYVTINANTNHKFFNSFNRLIEYTSNFINEKINE